jgi:hypothetical protein
VHAALLGAGQACADAPSVDKPSRIVVIGQQESADVRPGPFGLAVADNDEFLLLIALGVAPKLPIAGRKARIRALRDDALPLCAASGLQKSWAVVDV